MSSDSLAPADAETVASVTPLPHDLRWLDHLTISFSVVPAVSPEGVVTEYALAIRGESPLFAEALNGAVRISAGELVLHQTPTAMVARHVVQMTMRVFDTFRDAYMGHTSAPPPPPTTSRIIMP